MPHFPGHRPSRLQGLLDKGQGRGLFGPNIRQGGVALGPGRNTLIGPNPAATNAMGSAINRFAAPGLPTPTSPRVMNTGGAKVSDIFKNAQIGQFGATPAAQSPLAGYGQFGPQAQQVQQVQQAQVGPQTGDVNALAAAAGRATAGPPAQSWADVWAGGKGAGGPEDILAPSQSFFDRMMGPKGSGKRSDIGRAMMEGGAQAMIGRDPRTGQPITDPFASVGHIIQGASGAYGGLKEERRLQSDWEEDERRREEISAGIEAAIIEQKDADGNITRRALNDEEAAMVRATGGTEGITLARMIRQGTKKRAAIDTFAIGADDDYLELLRAYDDDTALGLVTDYAKSNIGKAGRKAHLMEMGYSEEVAEVAAQDAAGTQAALNRGMDIRIMADGNGVLRIFHKGEFVGSAGEGTPRMTDAEMRTFEAQQESLLWTQTEEARNELTRNFEVVKEEVDNFIPIYETIQAINQEEIEDYFGPAAEWNQFIDRWLGLEKTVLLDEVQQMLTKFGIEGLSAFTGAISEVELATALKNAGSITQFKPMLNAILMRAMDETIRLAESQGESAKFLDRVLGDSAVGRATDGTFWSSQNTFAFDMEELNTLRGEATEATAILDDVLSGEGGQILVAPQSVGPTAMENFLFNNSWIRRILGMPDDPRGVDLSPAEKDAIYRRYIESQDEIDPSTSILPPL